MLAPKCRRGYTLIEMVVTILIIGILASIAVPQYLNTVETGKADDAVSTVNMIGTTNKMFALDHNGFYVAGGFPSGAGASCGAGVCPATVVATVTGPTAGCNLVWCKYLADQDWGDKPYTYDSCDTAGGGGGHCGSPSAVAGTQRAGGSAPYSGWGYYMSKAGQITALGNAPTPTY